MIDHDKQDKRLLIVLLVTFIITEIIDDFFDHTGAKINDRLLFH
jgi:hypothetical protein